MFSCLMAVTFNSVNMDLNNANIARDVRNASKTFIDPRDISQYTFCNDECKHNWVRNGF